MIFTFFAGLAKAWKNYMLYRTTVYELNRLSNRDLYDLGIHRGDIEYLARKHSTGALKV